MKHYSEADLLETYYTQPGESMPVMMHLADCTDCAARYARLERKVRGLAACENEKPETFWARQRISIMRRVDSEGRRTSTFARSARLAAAAALVLVLGGVITLTNEVPETQAPAAAQPTVTASVENTSDSVTTDPWQSEELKDLQPVVAWESWVDAETKNGDTSL